MADLFILYGSRARGENRDDADIDLLRSPPSGSIERPQQVGNVSLHTYPQDWLLSEAAAGSLFAYHIANEGIALFDPDEFLIKLKKKCFLKDDYSDLRFLCFRIIRYIENFQSDWEYNIRRRYFWAMRSILISITAEDMNPIFSLSALERNFFISGLEEYFREKNTLTPEKIKWLGKEVSRISGTDTPNQMDMRNLRDWLTSMEGVGRNTVELIETAEAIDVGGLIHYM
jgi:hypothetical protein